MMKKLCCTIFFTCVAGLLMAQTIRVLSYNIHHARNEAGTVDVEALAQYLASVQADIIALQEVDSMCHRSGRVDMMQLLGQRTGMYYYFGKAMDFDGGGYGLGLLSRFPLRAVSTLPLPLAALPGAEPRAAVEATVTPPGKQAFKLLATHLDHLAADTNRLLQTQYLAERYLAEPLPFLLLGDINALPASQPLKQLLLVSMIPPQDRLLPTCPSGVPATKIDYILFSKNYPWKVEKFEVLPENFLSDHRPILATFTW